MASITAPTFDPINTATSLASKAIASEKDMLATQSSNATAAAKALSTLSAAISEFQTSLSSLAGLGKSMLAQSATLSDTTIGSATAKPTAPAGSYSLFVGKIATASQASYTATDGAAASGTLRIALSATDTSASAPTFTVDLSTANTDSDPTLSVREVAAAINRAAGNNGQVSAGVATINGVTQLVLTSKNTGVDNTVWISSAQSDPDNDPATPLVDDYALGARQELVAAQDAEFYFGGKNGTLVTQASNTFTGIDGVAFTATRAQAPAENAFTLNVAGDSSATTANVQAFVDAYNKLRGVLDPMLDAGDASSSKAAGAFAHDSSIKALQNRVVSLLRTSGSPSLASYGIIATRDGKLSLDSGRLTKQLAVNPDGLGTLIGVASKSNPTGVAGALSTYLDVWGNSTDGQLKTRLDVTKKLQSTLTQRQADMQTKYDSYYNRYLQQFTQLQTLQSAMNSNVSMFDALFGNKES
jgi:flagellar hook-associated protein 2